MREFLKILGPTGYLVFLVVLPVIFHETFNIAHLFTPLVLPIR